MSSPGRHEFVVVANRLPVDCGVDDDGHLTVTPSPGGLVTALKPVLEKYSGCWVGWPGTIGDIPDELTGSVTGFDIHPVSLTQRDYEEFYEGFSNATLWPLYHDLIVTPTYEKQWWETYREVNHSFAAAAAKVAAPGGTVWVQDYQLHLVPSIVRLTRPDVRIGFFLHIPFPAPELFRQLPWREEILRGLLGADVIGCHIPTSALNLLAAARDLDCVESVEIFSPTDTPTTDAHAPTDPNDPAAAVRQPLGVIHATDGRSVHVGAFPISIDSHAITTQAQACEPAPQLPGNPTIILGVDRMDYTKGILQRLTAFEELLASGAVDNAVLIQIATPSRERIAHYQHTRAEVERAVGRINGTYGNIGAPVVHYIHRSLPREELLAYYRGADVMLVTPYKDGMNLVAKEYVACHSDGSGALVLSEFAGAAFELQRAFLCNPYDVDSIKQQLVAAIKATRTGEGTSRMQALYQQVSECDVHKWAASFVDCLTKGEQ